MEILSVFTELFSRDTLTTCTVLSGLFFGWTIGSHYTGATLGMAYGAGIVKSSRVACLLVAFLPCSEPRLKVAMLSALWGPVSSTKAR